MADPVLPLRHVPEAVHARRLLPLMYEPRSFKLLMSPHPTGIERVRRLHDGVQYRLDWLALWLRTGKIRASAPVKAEQKPGFRRIGGAEFLRLSEAEKTKYRLARLREDGPRVARALDPMDGGFSDRPVYRVRFGGSEALLSDIQYHGSGYSG